MKRVFLLMVVSGLLVTLGLAQTPDAAAIRTKPPLKVAWVDLMATTQLPKMVLVRFLRSPAAVLISSHIWAMT